MSEQLKMVQNWLKTSKSDSKNHENSLLKITLRIKNTVILPQFPPISSSLQDKDRELCINRKMCMFQNFMDKELIRIFHCTKDSCSTSPKFKFHSYLLNNRISRLKNSLICPEICPQRMPNEQKTISLLSVREEKSLLEKL